MILINEEYLVQNSMDLNEFIEMLKGEVYDDNSEKVIDCIIDYLLDVWDRVEKTQVMINRYISEDMVPVAIVEVTDVTNYKTIEVRAVSKNGEDMKPKEADIVAFDEFCSKYFESLVTLYDRFCALDIE